MKILSQDYTCIDDTDTALHRSDLTRRSTKKNFEVLSAEEFIAPITQHIPEKNSRIRLRDKLQMARYHGPMLAQGQGGADRGRTLESQRLRRWSPRRLCSMGPSTNLGSYPAKPGEN